MAKTTTTSKSTPKRASAKKSASKKTVAKSPSRNFSSRRTAAVLAVLAVVVLTGGLALAHHAGPLNGVFSPISKTAPLMQQDSTKLYTADGLANSQSILVKFKSTTSSASIAAINKQNGASVRQTIAGIGVQQVDLPAGVEVGAALKQYRSHAEVAYAEPNFVAQRFLTPDDTLYAKQWNLAKINAPAAWDVSQGGYGPIAVIDTGIDAQHSDLSGEVIGGYNFVNNSTDTSDDNGHGTHVAGIIAATSNNSNGVASIGYKGSLMPVKVLDSTGSGTYAAVASGIIYAADNGAKIINLSLGGSSASQTLQSAVSYAEQKGVMIVAAAGNNGNNAAVYPADYPGVIAVSATATDDTLATFSSYGSNITVSAPGVDVISTYNNGGYATMSGTSMAAPEVAGLLGLAASHSQVTGSTLLSDLEQSADKVGSYPYNSSGWNQYFGYGRINAGKLLQLTGTTTAPAPTSAPTAPATTSGSQTTHGQPSVQFSVDFEGTVDSIDQTRGVVVVKIQSISQNLKLANNNLIDVYITGNTSLTEGNQSLTLASLQPGQKLAGKALWHDNRLSATTLTAQGGGQVQSSAPAPSNSAPAGQGQSSQGRRPQ